MTTLTKSAIDNKVAQVVSNIRNLPTPPIVFNQIQKVINDPDVSAAHVASILAEDPAMSVKVLKLTNSAFYGLSREVESVKHAVVIVGMEAIKNLVLAASVLDMFKGKSFNPEDQEKFWRHSLAVASCSRLLARQLKSKGIIDPDSAFSAGLLHDIGKLVICCFLQEEQAVLEEEFAKDQNSSAFIIEEKALGYNHAQVGAQLALQWKLPQRLFTGIAYHHRPMEAEGDDPIAMLIHLGDYVARKTFLEPEEARVEDALADGVLEYMQINEQDLFDFSEVLKEEYLKAETFMQMAGLD